MAPGPLALAVLLLAAAPAKTKLLVMPLAPGEGMSEGTARALTAAALGEIRKRPAYTTLTGDDVQAVLSVERQRQLLGCAESACLAEIGGALGVDQVVTGSVARLGQSYLVHLQRVDARKATVLRSADRRKKGASLDDVLDEIPAMVEELFGPPGAPASRGMEPPAPTPSVNDAPKLASPAVEEPLPLAAEVRATLQVATDGKGHYLAFVPLGGMDAPLLAGSAEALHAQYVGGGGSSGTEQFSLNFWDPRTHRGAEAELDFHGGAYALTCGAQTIAFTRLPPAQERAFLAKAKLLAPRWRRQAVALGRDDDGTYYFVDGPRDARAEEDLHLFIGRKGHVAPVKVTEVLRDGGRLLVESEAGTLSLPTGDSEQERRNPGQFRSAAGTKAVTALDLWQQRAMIYTALGAYAGERLGTACDPFLAP